MIKFETPQFLQRFKDRVTAKVATATLVVLAGGGMVYRGITVPRGTTPTKAAKVKVATGAQLTAQKPEEEAPLYPEDTSKGVYQPPEETLAYSPAPEGASVYDEAPPPNELRGAGGAFVDPNLEPTAAEEPAEQPPANPPPSLYGNTAEAPPVETPPETAPPSEPSSPSGGAPAFVTDQPPPSTEAPGLMAPPPAGNSIGKGSLKRRGPSLSPKNVPAAPAPPAGSLPGTAGGLTPPARAYLGSGSSAPAASPAESPVVESSGGNLPSDGLAPAEPPRTFAPAGTATPPESFPSANPHREGGSAQPGSIPPGRFAPEPSAVEGGVPPITSSPSMRSVPSIGDKEIAAGTAATPGDRQLEGAQTPAVTLEKMAPAEIQVGRPATFEVRVRNVGQVAAHQVVVSDQIPKGTQLQGTKPEAKASADGSLIWQLGTIPPGQEVVLAMQVVPEEEGEIGSIAQVGFAAQASARSVCTRPLLKVEHTAPKQVLIGEMINVSIQIQNPGSGAATGVIIEEDVPEGLEHDGGRELEYEVGVLRPGESRRLDLQMRATKAGIVQNTIHVRGEGNLTAQHDVQIEVIAPQLNIGIDGPKKRFLDRQATYTLSLANPGTAPARNVEMVAYLPKGVKFVQTDSQGQYDARQHAVFWALEELPQQKKGTVRLTVLPVEAGEQVLRIDGRAELGLTATQEQTVQVEGVTELAYSIADLADPVEVGGENTYEIRVVNNGSRAVTNVVVVAQMPQGLTAKEGEGPTAASTAGQKVTFEPLARMNPQDEAVFRIHCQAITEGDFIMKVQLACDEFPTPVSKEESTRVYADR